ncbi:MAG: hypothetical protein RIS88_567 [Pseudomonadota bacterium]
MSASIALPAGVQVFERGWLSANNILFTGDGPSALIDSGYCTHAPQTLDLVARALQGRGLDLLLNTHLHSDHCGGNAALQGAHPSVQTLIPPGHFSQVQAWDAVALTYIPTGQLCPRFRADGVLSPGTMLRLGVQDWQVHAAPGHDPHSIVLFEPASRVLISADALWENGFGVVFPELEGQRAFDEVGLTLDLIESLAPAVVIPGHGSVFTRIDEALAAARKRLEGFIAAPAKHARHAAKVLLKFKLLELQAFSGPALHEWAARTTYLETVRRRWEPDLAPSAWLEGLADDLVRAGAARREGADLINA